MAAAADSLSALRHFTFNDESYTYYSLQAAQENGAGEIMSLPRSLKVLYENMLRHEDGISVTADHLKDFYSAVRERRFDKEVFFRPTRLLMNDSAGIPLMADLAALRAAVADKGGDPQKINPLIQADMVVDHSVMVDVSGQAQALTKNLDLEFERNAERYQFLRWAQQAFTNFRVVPPGIGICHQVNVEFLARVIWTQTSSHGTLIFPETLLGTDSHTPMINSLGILGWGVGGIEGGAAMLGQPITMALPRVVGCRLTGSLPVGVTATDLVLTLTQRLREYKVVAAFVEYFGPGLASLSASDRATVANMAPEYGATMGFFPVDELTLQYLAQTNRGEANALIEHYAREQGLWHEPEGPQPVYDELIEIDLSEIRPSIAGPRRPQDRVLLKESATRFEQDVYQSAPPLQEGGVPVRGHDWTLDHGDIVIASITSCTNTSNPANMLTAGLLARNAVKKGLSTKPWVKSSLAPGSRVVADYLSDTGLQTSLDQLGFNLVAFGCATCMGNSGPLAPEITEAIENSSVASVAVLSGNRNFEGRIHPLARANYICSPPLVVAYALAGSMRVDFEKHPLGHTADGEPVYLADIWPDPEEVAQLVNTALKPDRFLERYATAFDGEERWQALPKPRSKTFQWDPQSLYMKEPPFFQELSTDLPARSPLEGARALLILGDSITTDHISPVGAITASSAAGRYLQSLGVAEKDFNSFAARRVNHNVMLRGTFANIRIRNEMADGREGGWTRYMPNGELLPIHEAAARYREEGVPLIVIAGKDYGAGSSRDWAAKGTHLLGIRAVVAEGFERIHRSNLIGMGVLPLEFQPGVNRQTLQLDGTETFDIHGVQTLEPRCMLTCVIKRADGTQQEVELRCRLDTPLELAYYENGGILHYIGRQILRQADIRN